MTDLGISLEIKMEKPRGTKRGAPAPPATWRQALTAGLGVEIRDRVTRRGQTVETPTLAGSGPGYGAYRTFVHAGAPGASAGKLMPSGSYMFDNLAAYHVAAGVTRGTGNVTGALWRGLSHVPTGSGGVLRFRSSSQSYLSKLRLTNRLVRLERGQHGPKQRVTTERAVPMRVDNALKAWVVLNKQGVNLLSYTEHEADAMRHACATALRGILSKSIGMPVDWRDVGAAGHNALAGAMVARMNRGIVSL